ncbi:MAG TPA: choice-of-anchor U domain-containing protein [Desulfobacterales bacterium]
MTGTRAVIHTTAKTSILAGFVLLFLLSGNARGAEVHLEWDANTEADLAGYVIYYGTQSGIYPFSKDLDKNNTHCIVTDLTEGQTYYFAATAYDTSDNHSGYSEELVYQVPAVDTDGDGLSDSAEIEIYGTDPNDPDTDGDGLSDGAEIQTYQTNPLKIDSDGDGLNDGAEVGTHQTNPKKADTDGDGLDDGVEIQTYFSNPKSADTDGDGLIDGMETNTYGTDPTLSDSDNDGLTDGAEVKTYGTDPLDADSDQDGYTDGQEIELGLDPNKPEGNHPPDQPVIQAPLNRESDTELTPTLQTASFSDPDSGDYHRQTQWQVSTSTDFSTPVYNLTTDRYLTSLQLPDALLDTARTYYWKARFYDRAQEPSPWSQTRNFTTVSIADNDINQNGIPDDQEVDDTSDLDEDLVPDNLQSDMKVVRVATGDDRIAIKGSSNVTAIETLMSIPTSRIEERYAKPKAMPYEVISFRFHVEQPGDTAQITIFFSKPAPEGSKWWKYDLQSGWQDYSSHAVFSANRKKLTLELTDGGLGDGDGVKNGVILDPSGLATETASMSDGLEGQLENVFAGCFIGAATGIDGPDKARTSMPAVAATVFSIGLLMVALGLIFQVLRKKICGSDEPIGDLSGSPFAIETGHRSPEMF